MSWVMAGGGAALISMIIMPLQLIAGVALMAAAFGIINTMMTVIHERHKTDMQPRTRGVRPCIFSSLKRGGFRCPPQTIH